MTTDAFDVVVVGAGSAGCVAATVLSADPARRVLLLEAGPDDPVDAVPEELRVLSRPVRWPYDWGDAVELGDGRTVPYSRGRGTGGSSSTNGGVALRADPDDLARWPTGWRWDDLLPSLLAVEHDHDFGDRPWHGDAGPLPIVRWPELTWTPMQGAFVAACEALGFARCADHNEPGTTGVGPIPMNRSGLLRISARQAFLDPVRDRANLTVRGDAHAHRVVVRDGRAVGVELVGGEVVEAGAVVLAAGVVQDPLLLWRSGIGPADRLRALGATPVVDLPAVGAHLTDHPVVTVAVPIHPETAPDGAPSLQTILRCTAPGSDRHDDLQVTPWVRRHGDGRRELGMSVSLQLPDGEGSIEPTGPDAGDRPRIRWPFTTQLGNVARLRDGWRLALDLAAASGLALEPAALDRARAVPDGELDAEIVATHGAFYHGVGTCRVGAESSSSVVDRAGRVHGVDGLAIVDASVIPTVPRTNTNLVVLALAHHLATALTGAAPPGRRASGVTAPIR